MAKKVSKRPDEARMRAVIESNQTRLVAVVFRLAWDLGLTPSEMAELTWDTFSFAEGVLRLPDREIPMDEETALFLQRRKENTERFSPYVLLADRTHTHTSVPLISRTARKVLDEAGLTDITLLDLRHDYIIRQLEKHDWHYVAYMTGCALTTLYQNYGQYFVGSLRPQKEETVPVWPVVDEEKLCALIEALGDAVEGLVLRLCWQLEAGVSELVELTWEEVDLERGTITLADGKKRLDGELLSRLRTLKASRSEADDPHVLLTPRSRRPYSTGVLSKTVSRELIRAGMAQITLRDIARLEKRKNARTRVLQLLRENGRITQAELRSHLKLSVRQTGSLTGHMVEEGSIVQIGDSFYLPGSVVPPEQHEAVIRAFLLENGIAYREDLRRILGVTPKQCTWILRRFVEAGTLVRTGQRYTLPEEFKA